MPIEIEVLQDLVTAQADQVRALKGAQEPNLEEIQNAIGELKQLKIDLNSEIDRRKRAGDLQIKSKEDFRQKVAMSLESRLFYIPSFKIYGGVGGLFDYGTFCLLVRLCLVEFWIVVVMFA
jgi:glycyl-tRNA synthetase